MHALIDFRASQPNATDALRCAFTAPLAVLVARTHAEVPEVLAQVAAHAAQGHWCVGHVAYEAAPAFDAALCVHPSSAPLACFGVFAQAQPWPEDPTTGAAAQATWQPGVERVQFDTAMVRIHAAIAAGDLYQVNYTAPLSGQLQGEPLALFQALLRAQPGGYSAYLDHGDSQILSVSPELFFDWKAPHILTRPMKGTAPRGRDPQDDARLAAQLRASPKERAENVMIVDLLRNDLSRIAEPFSVQVPDLFHVETLPTVLQMRSDVVARTRADTTLVDVFRALFPCGSITGAPKVQAMRLIHALEPQARGVYCGAIGVVRPGGHATFSVAIRTVVAHASQLRCGIGSGITSDARAEGEWQEWQHKRAFLERASTPFDILETLRLHDGQLHATSLHVARMARAAQHFGYAFRADEAHAALEQLALAHPQGLFRVRLLLGAHGHLQAQAVAMEATPSPVRIQLADTPLYAARSEFVRFKTTHRAHYDAFAPQQAGVFDTLLWNAQGQLTECTRCNVALKLQGQWVTPALECGLLDGVERERLLRAGSIREGILTRDMLAHCEGLAVFNSLRGWLDAQWVGAADQPSSA